MLASPPSYAFNASAIALGGVLRKGNASTVVPTIGSVSLASAGGEAENTVDNYFRDDISLLHASTRVSGYWTALPGGLRRYSTYSEVTLKNLKVFNRLEVGYMKAIVESTRVIDTTASDPICQLQPDSSKFSIIVRYENIIIDGQEVTPLSDYDALCTAGTYDNFLDHAATFALAAPENADESFEAIKKVKELRDGKPALGTAAADRVVPWHRPPVNVPLVKLAGPPGLVSPHGNRANVPTFGKARFGDAIIKPDRLRVALLRLTLDSDWQKDPTSDAIVLNALANDATRFANDVGDGNGGSLSSDGGNNGVPIWP
jgi:hypothetical protein